MDDDDDDEIEDPGYRIAYLVRLKPDQQHPREFVGVFVAWGVPELRELVDEACPTAACEHAVLPSGGIFQPGRSYPIPLPKELMEAEADHFKGACISDLWWNAFMRDDTLEWHAVDIGYAGAANDWP